LRQLFCVAAGCAPLYEALASLETGESLGSFEGAT
jgi:hypothetical protein